ncbi:hypothetical protein Cni_G09984 [Canna indica]|uniref:MULE transposase domain-containing protein n=1 Tax=Canna indica TaxID=4628 RepID=A0AAQ3K5V3_9LILI|nr:hypothetical protein Cni_G09984 [Canna indica]
MRRFLQGEAKDPNDQYYPLAVAMVESKNMDSWKWFLQILLDDIGRNKNCVFISDQQKGIVHAIVELSGCVKQRTEKGGEGEGVALFEDEKEKEEEGEGEWVPMKEEVEMCKSQALVNAPTNVV